MIINYEFINKVINDVKLVKIKCVLIWMLV